MTHRTLPASTYYVPKGKPDATPILIHAGKPVPEDAIVSKRAEEIFAANLKHMDAKQRADLAAARAEGKKMAETAASEQARLASEKTPAAKAETAAASKEQVAAAQTATPAAKAKKTGGAGQAPVKKQT